MEKTMKLVRLTSGEEIVCQVKESEDAITISDAFSLIAPEPGKIGFIPFMAYSKNKEFTISKQFVILVVDPVDEMVDQVRTMTTGIVTPNQQGIIT